MIRCKKIVPHFSIHAYPYLETHAGSYVNKSASYKAKLLDGKAKASGWKAKATNLCFKGNNFGLIATAEA